MRPKLELSNAMITQHDFGKAVFFDFRVGVAGKKVECLEWLTDDLQLVGLEKSNIVDFLKDGLLESEEEVIHLRDRLEEHLDRLLGSLRSKAAASVTEAAE